LSNKQAAAYLLSRFTFGAKPNEIEEVVEMGVEKWFALQLDGKLNDDSLQSKLSRFNTLQMSITDIVSTYPNPGTIANIARKKYEVDYKKDSNATSRRDYKDEIKAIMKEEGFKPIAELNRELVNQKLERAIYSNNQLQEVLTDFWFNHFNVSLTKAQAVQYILPYERDVIRPNVVGNFSDLVIGTAQHPAMLEYLDNASSVSNDNKMAPIINNSNANKKFMENLEMKAADKNSMEGKIANQVLNQRRTQGLNENYAREVMELHTMGVDGGYTQNDVTQVARALTGWSVFPLSKYSPGRALVDRIGVDKLKQRGFIIKDGFLFRADKHDEKEKIILGETFPENGGYEEGIKVLQKLSTHPSTAKFISTKLASRFVSDNPPTELVQKMSETFLKSKGNIKAVLIEMVNSKEFWIAAKNNEKVKSPFELVVSSVRATNATIEDPFQLFNWCTKMGQRFYYYLAPTGFPDKASYWINTGSLLNRMNFGLAFATDKIPGVKQHLLKLNQNHEPESISDALTTYSKILLPERNHEKNIERLTKVLSEGNFAKKIEEAVKNTPNAYASNSDMLTTTDESMQVQTVSKKQVQKNEKAALSKKNNTVINVAYATGNNSMIGQVVGVIIGSPEFQKK
ncbi:MAG: DUF1800 domain-containing protein, partial [Chitinophagaceae bacterium]